VGEKKPPIPAPGSADSLGQITLRRQFQFDFAGMKQGIEYMRVSLARE